MKIEFALDVNSLDDLRTQLTTFLEGKTTLAQVIMTPFILPDVPLAEPGSVPVDVLKAAAEAMQTETEAESEPEPIETKPARQRNRPPTGRPRGRPAGSLNKSKIVVEGLPAEDAAKMAADVAAETVTATETVIMQPAAKPTPAVKPVTKRRSAAEIALSGDDDDDDADTGGDEPDDDMQSMRAQLAFDYDRVLAANGPAAAKGIITGILGRPLDRIENMPVALIQTAITALREAQT